jgi:fatty-acyl-CoA synthase
MFHANAWGLPHASVMAGSALVFPGPQMSPATIANLIEDERVTVAAAVPTVWMGALDELVGRNLSALRTILCGGSAVPAALSEAYRLRLG